MTSADDEFTKKKKHAIAPIFLSAGAALYECQNFEFSMKAYLLCLCRLGSPGVEMQDVLNMLNNSKKITAGGLIKKLHEHVPTTNQPPAIFSEALEARNRIVHDMLIQNVQKFSSARGRAETLQEIHSLTVKVNRANAVLAPFIEKTSSHLDGERYQELLAEFEKNFE